MFHEQKKMVACETALKHFILKNNDENNNTMWNHRTLNLNPTYITVVRGEEN